MTIHCYSEVASTVIEDHDRVHAGHLPTLASEALIRLEEAAKAILDTFWLAQVVDRLRVGALFQPCLRPRAQIELSLVFFPYICARKYG